MKKPILILFCGCIIAFVVFAWNSETLDPSSTGGKMQIFFHRFTPEGRASYRRGVELSEIVCDYSVKDARVNTKEHSECLEKGSEDPSKLYVSAFGGELGTWNDLTQYQQEATIEEAKSRTAFQKGFREAQEVFGF